MLYTIENDILKVCVDSFGAEIKSVFSKNKNIEYMWQGDKKYWGRTSPVLFPFVGRLKNNEYSYNGKKYSMGQHGFARDMEFSLLYKSETELNFILMYDESTLKNYPFKFSLNIGYKLLDNNVLVSWKVKNEDDKEIIFSIGAHPAFNCPINGEDTKEGYSLFFDGANEIHHHGNDVDTGLSLKEDILIKLDKGKAKITKDFFDRCTYMIEDGQVKSISILEKNENRYVTVEFDMPLVALWSPEGMNAPFLCIEPWCGRCDAIDFEGDLKDRAFSNKLSAGCEFDRDYKMIFE